MERRLENELQHGRHLAASGAASIWNWDSPAGKLRWARRAAWLCRDLKPGQRVLELGCGTGLFTRELAKTGASITAIDISPELLDMAREGLGSSDVVLKIANAYALSDAAETYDWIVGSSVLHHLDVPAALAEAQRVLKTGGSLRFTEPNMLNPQIMVQKNVAWLKRRLGDSPDETAFFRWDLAKRLRAAGFEGTSLTPFDFLHPAIPAAAMGWAQPVAAALERVPGLREIAGSLMIEAKKAGPVGPVS